MTAPDFTAADMTRVTNYFAGCSTFAGLTKFEPTFGPWPESQRSLADVVAEIATGRAA